MHVPSVFAVSIERNLGEAHDLQFVYCFSVHVKHVDSQALQIKSEESRYCPVAEAHEPSHVRVALFPNVPDGHFL